MKAINRGTGLTESERYLARLADRTFLDLWSYPNTFNDRRNSGKGSGQELCDLLVVCGDDVIIFSDKSCAWPENSSVELSWSRWFRRAVTKSVDQIRGAERWLKRYPERVFIDSLCTTPLPIALPPAARMRVHGIAVALGAQKACARFYNDPDGSLMVRSHLRGADHTDPSKEGFTPFAFGDVDPEGPFVHVFDETALNLVMREMSTIADFTAYLVARETAIRGAMLGASSEADMLAAYLQVEDGNGDHFFPTPVSEGGEADQVLVIPQGEYHRYLHLPQRKAKVLADRQSIAWDRLIQAFTGNLLAGTSVELAGMKPEVSLAERALRVMALERRVARRALATAFLGALQEAERRGKDRFARMLIQTEGLADPECGYLFLVLAYRGASAARGYDQYRELRVGMLRAYCEVALYNYRHLKRMVGIAVDASPKLTNRPGGSEDLMLLEILDWTPEQEQRVAQLQKDAAMLVPARLRQTRLRVTEYPELHAEPEAWGNRAQRRAAKSKKRRGRQG